MKTVFILIISGIFFCGCAEQNSSQQEMVAEINRLHQIQSFSGMR